MGNERIIRIHGPITEEAFTKFCIKLDRLAKDPAPIWVELMSEGGTHYDSLAFVGKIRSCPRKIHIVGFGHVMSAAVLILAAGDKRYLSEEAWVMVHEDQGKTSGSTTEVTKEVVQMRREEQQWCDLMHQYTGTPESVWRKLSKKTTYLDAQEALQLGIIDEIIKGFKK